MLNCATVCVCKRSHRKTECSQRIGTSCTHRMPFRMSNYISFCTAAVPWQTINCEHTYFLQDLTLPHNINKTNKIIEHTLLITAGVKTFSDLNIMMFCLSFLGKWFLIHLWLLLYSESCGIHNWSPLLSFLQNSSNYSMQTPKHFPSTNLNLTSPKPTTPVIITEAKMTVNGFLATLIPHQ